jgi:hypothetical protein
VNPDHAGKSEETKTLNPWRPILKGVVIKSALTLPNEFDEAAVAATGAIIENLEPGSMAVGDVADLLWEQQERGCRNRSCDAVDFERLTERQVLPRPS